MPIKPLPDYFDKLGNKAYLLVVALIILIELIVFRSYFLEKIYCFRDIGGDAYNQYFPYQYLTSDYITKYGLPKWSFNVGMGQSLFQFILRDPFDIFLYLAGKDHILYLLVYKEMLKILLSGLTFFFYLKTLKLSNFTAVIGSLLFAFCGFLIVGSVWNDGLFSFPAFNMAVLLLGFELLFIRQKWYLFPVGIFLIGISMPFNLYLFSVFITCYAVLRHLQTGPFNFKKLGALFLKMAALGMIGLLISAPFFIENLLGTLYSPRGTGGYSRANTLSSAPIFNLVDLYQFGICVMRFFSTDIMGGQNDPHGWTNYFESPMFYCGILCLFLLPQVFQFLTKRVKIVFGVFLALWLLPILFPYLRQAFWLFSGDYYRTYAFFIALIFLYYAMLALENIVQQGKINRPVLFATVVVLFILINYPFFAYDIVDSNISFFAMTMFLAYGLILFFVPKQKNVAYTKWLILIAVVVEAIFISVNSVNERDAYTFSDLNQKTGYNDYTVNAVNYIKQTDTSFYRIDKYYGSAYDVCLGYHNTLDDGMAEGYYGTSCYNSFNQEYYVNYLELMGAINKVVESTIRAQGLVTYPVLEAENSVKYILLKTPIPPVWGFYYDSLTQCGDVKVLRNKLVLPLGYTYDTYIKESDFKALSPIQRNFASIRTCVVNDNDLDKVSSLFEFKGSTDQANWNRDLLAHKRNVLDISRFSQNYITGTITTDGDKMLYLSIPYDIGWSAKVDGQPTDKIILNDGMTGVVLKAGSHTVELTYELPYFKLGLLLCLSGLLIYFGYWFYTRRKPGIIS